MNPAVRFEAGDAALQHLALPEKLIQQRLVWQTGSLEGRLAADFSMQPCAHNTTQHSKIHSLLVLLR